MGLFDFIGNMIGLATEPGRVSAANQQQWDMANQNYNNQKEFAQHAISYRVQDAQRAGIHPLYAMGASVPSFSPSSMVGATDRSGDYLRGMGQSIDRAIAAHQSGKEREQSAQEKMMDALALERAGLQNDVLRAQLASINARLAPGQVGVSLPNSASPSTAQTGQAEIKPNEITSSQGEMPSAAAGPVAPSNQWRVAPDGIFYPTPEKNLQIDDMGSPGWIPWMYRNHILPFAKGVLGQDNTYAWPPRSQWPPGVIGWSKQPDGGLKPIYENFDDAVQRSRHNRRLPKWADPQYRRF